MKLETYIAADEQEENPDCGSVELNYNALYQTIYGAVYEAMKKALSE